MDNEKFKPTLKKPTEMGKDFNKNSQMTMNSKGVGHLLEVDKMLQEKEQSLKKKIWDLSKMEALVHGDEKLSAIYNDMAQDGEEKYGYHYNETIMNMIFNDHVLNSVEYLQKYKNAVPKEKKRRDKSGIEQLKNELGTDEIPNKDMGDVEEDVESNFNPINGMGYDHQDDSVRTINRNHDTVKNTNENQEPEEDNSIDETTTSASSGSYETKYAFANGNKMKHAKEPAWDGGTVIGESNYLVDPKGFKLMFEALNLDNFNEGMNSPADDSRVPMAEAIDENMKQMLLRAVASLTQIPDNLLSDDAKKLLKNYQEKLRQMGALNYPKDDMGGLGEGNINEHHLNSPEQQAEFIAKNLKMNKDAILQYMNPEQIKNLYLGMEKTMGAEANVNMVEATSYSEITLKLSDILPIAQQVYNAPAGQDERIVKKFIEAKSMSPDKFKEEVQHYLGQRGASEDATFYALENLVNISRDMVDQNRPSIEKPKHDDDFYDNALARMQNYVDTNPEVTVEESADDEHVDFENTPQTSSKFHMLMRLVDKHAPHKGFKGQLEELAKFSQLTVDTFFGGDIDKAITHLSKVIPKANESIIDTPPDSMVDDSGSSASSSSMMGSSSTSGGSGMFENNTIDEDGHCRKDEVPIAGKVAGEKGSCKKKRTYYRDTEELKNNKHNVEFRKKRMTDYEKKVDNKKTEYDKELDKHIKQTHKLKEGMGITEEVGSLIKLSDFVQKYSLQPSGAKYVLADFTPVIANPIDKDDTYDFALFLANKMLQNYGLSWNDLGDINSMWDYIEGVTDMEEFKRQVKEAVQERINDEMGGYFYNESKETKNEENMNEDRKPSSLVMLDRLKKDNSKNFKDNIKDTNIGDAVETQDELMGKYTAVGENPQKLSQDIEKEKLAIHKEKNLENVGNSANANGKEIPKRNLEDEELEEIDLMRKGMQDLRYDNEPDERFEERMKKDMGEDIYKLRQKKKEYYQDQPMYNKDPQPVVESITFAAKYKDGFGKNVFTNFSTSEVKLISKTKLTEGFSKLSLDGMGNNYTTRVELNESAVHTMEKYDFYYSDGKFYATAKDESVKQLNEEKTSVESPSPINESLDKMRKLWGYKPANFVDTNKIKKNRGF